MNINLSVNNNNNAFTKPLNRPYLPQTVPTTSPFLNKGAALVLENNNQISFNGDSINQIWSQHSFNNHQEIDFNNKNNNTMSWAEMVNSSQADQDNSVLDKLEEIPVTVGTLSSDGDGDAEGDHDSDGFDKEDNTSPSHHARRPMNAFLIFCKKHRPIVRENFPTLENRGVTKILGEWWSLLDDEDKKPYTDLAKEYKDKFMSENPGFKWYKLPAPPLRTLNARPPIVHKSPPPMSSPTSPVQVAEFTPGKLADESQLGSLTSLLNDCTAGPKVSNDKVMEHQNENINTSSISEEIFNNSLLSPVNLIKASVPPKPLKKRPYDHHNLDNKTVARNILNTHIDISPDSRETQELELIHDDSNLTDVFNMTKQDVVDRSVDSMFTRLPENSNGFREVRKSGRSCKGKRYEQFMVEGKLLGNKRDTKLTQQKFLERGTKIECQLSPKLEEKPEMQTPKLGLESTIKRLAERTNIKINLDDKKPEEIVENKSNDRLRTISETSDDSFTKNMQPSSFNLDLRISNLPCLSYAQYLQRKKESKKRKSRFRSDSESKRKMQKMSQEPHLTGAKKRKNKHKITHLNSNDGKGSTENDLSRLTMLAEIAMKTEKLDEQSSPEK